LARPQEQILNTFLHLIHVFSSVFFLQSPPHLNILIRHPKPLAISASTTMSTSQNSTVSSRKSSTSSVRRQPSELSDSYFPRGETASIFASATSPIETAETPLGSSPSGLDYPLSPLDREYAKPMKDLDVAEQLAKQPTYWSVKGWVQRSVSSSTKRMVEDRETRARKFEEVKRDLLASAGRL